MPCLAHSPNPINQQQFSCRRCKNQPSYYANKCSQCIHIFSSCCFLSNSYHQKPRHTPVLSRKLQPRLNKVRRLGHREATDLLAYFKRFFHNEKFGIQKHHPKHTFLSYYASFLPNALCIFTISALSLAPA
jgi:hypothetical protein